MGGSLSCCSSQQEGHGGTPEDIVSGKDSPNAGRAAPPPAGIEVKTEDGALEPSPAEVSPPQVAADDRAAAPPQAPEPGARVDEGAYFPSLEPTEQPPDAARAAKPDLNGRWLMSSYEGDFNAFMTEVGAPWIARKAAGAMNYGVGKQIITIEMKGDELSMTRPTPMGTFQSKHIVNGCEQDEVEPFAKKPMKVTPSWEELPGGRVAFRLEGFNVADKSKIPTVRRWLDAGNMIQESTTPKGLTIKVVFSKLPDTAD